ncbi:MAG TPA: TetR/AcrR family transcriptional regulator [Pyrinomonadaceae bacterium]|nr:TetR/AcrR family transcriptional regulator [Pyrinomonadaceae bacterium]
MSGNDHLVLANMNKKTDARVRRTRDALGDALVALMQEKPFDTITVQDVLDRAHVGRSTFYSHYSDKDDLLMSDADEFYERLAMGLSAHGEKSDRVFPVKEFFGHIVEAKQFVNALTSAGKMEEQMDLAREHFARGIERRLSELPRGQSISPADRAAVAFAHAGALLSLLSWWVDRGMKQTPAEMDQLFHRIVWGS